MSRVWLGPSYVQVTGADDDVAHLVLLRLYERSLAAGHGRFAAACERSVLAASMSAAPGRTCALCRAAERDRPAP